MNGPYTLFILIISLFVFNFVSGCLEEKDGEIIRMTFEEFINDYHQDNVNTSGNTSRQFRGWYSTLNVGDTVVIEDTLQKMMKLWKRQIRQRLLGGPSGRIAKIYRY